MRKLMFAGLTCIGLLGFVLPADAQSDCKNSRGGFTIRSR